MVLCSIVIVVILFLFFANVVAIVALRRSSPRCPGGKIGTGADNARFASGNVFVPLTARSRH